MDENKDQDTNKDVKDNKNDDKSSANSFNSTKKTGEQVFSTTFKNIFVTLSILSPFFTIILFTLIGCLNRVTGLIYVVCILVSIMIRKGILWKFFKSLNEGNSPCNLVSFTGMGITDMYLGLWVWAFTFFYVLLPLLSKNILGTDLILFLVIFGLLGLVDMAVKLIYKCFPSGNINKNIVFNIFGGGLFGIAFASILTLANAEDIFFNRKSSKETCRNESATKFTCDFDG